MAFFKTSQLMEALNYGGSGGSVYMVYMTNGNGSIMVSQYPTLTTLTLGGGAGSSTLSVGAPSNGSYAISASGYTTTGQSNGIYVNAGTNSSDLALAISNQAQTSALLYVYGNGAVTMSGTLTVTGLLTASGGITGSIGQTTAAAGSFTTLSASGTLALGSQTGDNILIHGTVGYNWINFEEGSASKFSMGPFNTGHFQIYSTNGLNANVLDITGSSGLVTVPYNLGVSGTSTLTGNVTVGTLGSGNVSNSVLIQGSSANGYGPFVQFVDGTGSMGAVGSSNSWGTGNARGMAFAATNALQFLTNNGTLALTLDTSQNATFAGQVIVHDATFHRTLTTMTNGAASNTGTLTNAPVAGNPTKWVPVNDNGTTRYVPMW